jgi:signal transduction histidine kinase
MHRIPSPASDRPAERHPLDSAADDLSLRIGDLTHDLNNALLAIRGYATILRETLQSPQQLADADEITGAAERATDLARRLGELGRSRAA